MPTTVLGEDGGEHTLLGPVAVAWEATLDGPEGGSDTADSIILGADQGSVFVGGTVTSGPLQDYIWPTTAFGTVAYDARTGVQLWSTHYENSALPVHSAIDMDASRNGRLLALTGYAWKGLDTHIVVVGIDPRTGADLWQVVDRTDRSQYVADLTFSPDSAKVFIAGSRHQSTPEGYLNGVPDAIVESFDADTGSLLWRDVYQTESNSGSSASSIAVSPDGRTLYVAGQSMVGEYPQTHSVATLLAYDTSTGERRWVWTYPPLSEETLTIENLMVSPDGWTVYSVGGWIDRTSPWKAGFMVTAFDTMTGSERWFSTHPLGAGTLGPVQATLSSDGRRVFVVGYDYLNDTDLSDLLVAGYDTAHGSLLWEASYGTGPGQSDMPSDIAVSQNGRMVVITGRSGSPSVPISGPSTPPPPPIVRSFATVGYDAQTGKRLWAAHYLGPAGRDGMGTSVAIAKNGRRVFVTGFTDGLTGPPGGEGDYFTVAYDVFPPRRPAGVLVHRN